LEKEPEVQYLGVCLH